MNLTVEFFIQSTERELKIWEKGIDEIKNGTFKYDDSMPKCCVVALYQSKVLTCNNTLKYLRTLDENLVISTDRGTTEEGQIYYKLINS